MHNHNIPTHTHTPQKYIFKNGTGNGNVSRKKQGITYRGDDLKNNDLLSRYIVRSKNSRKILSDEGENVKDF